MFRVNKCNFCSKLEITKLAGNIKIMSINYFGIFCRFFTFVVKFSLHLTLHFPKGFCKFFMYIDVKKCIFFGKLAHKNVKFCNKKN